MMNVIFMNGDEVFVEKPVGYGNTLGIAGMPTPEAPEGKEFAGWYTEDGICVKHGITITSDMVAYATWKDANVPDTGDNVTLIPALILGMLAVTGTAILISKKNLIK